MRLIDADAIESKIKKQYCEDCDRRKGIKNGKSTFCYEIGDAPCRACGIDDMYAELDDAPTIHPEPCDDAVSRQAVKDLAHNQMREKYAGIKLKERREFYIRLADSVINLLPPVTPKPKTGKWMHVSEEMWKCDQCGEISCCSPKYCPDCGSRNEVTT